MNATSTVSLILGGLLPALPAAAQRLAAYDPTAMGGPGFLEFTGASALLPPGTPPLLLYPELPPLPPPPVGFGVPPGDSTCNGITGLLWYTNGALVAAMPSPTIPVPAAPVPPFPVPAAVLAAIGGPVTGMAIDPAAGVMYLVSAPGVVVGVTPVPAMPIVVPPFVIPFLPVMGPISGLDYDSLSGALYAVSVAGAVCSFVPPGLPLMPPLFPAAPLPLPLPPAQGVALDKTGRLNGAGLRAIYVAAPPLVFDLANPAFAPLPIGGPATTGLAFLPAPAGLPPAGVCPCASHPALSQFQTGPMTAGSAGFALNVGGLPAGQLTVFILDFAFNPAFPVINSVGCGLGFFFGSPTLSTALGFAGPGGVATFALPLSLVPPGAGPIYYQAGTFCPADSGGIVSGIVLTPVQVLSACGL